MAQKSIIDYSKLSDYLGRIDAEFYKPISLHADDIIKGSKYKPLGDLVLAGYRVVYENTKILKSEDVKVGVDARFMQSANISNDGLWIDVNNIGYVDQKDWNRYPKGRIIKGELLIEVKGQAEKVTIVQDYIPERTLITGTLFKLSLKPNTVSHEYIFAFFSSKYGKILRDRTKVNTLIAYVSKPELYRIPVPLPSIEAHNLITSLVADSFKYMALAKSLNQQATIILEQELGLDKITFERKKSYEASFSEVAITRRMNAEYFSPLVKKILSQSFLINSKPIGELFQIIRGTSPKGYFENGIPVIKTKNIRVPEIDRERVSDFVQSTKDLTAIQENDLLLASMGVGSLGRMSYILSLDEDMVVDGTIRVFRRKSSTTINYEIPTLLFLSTKVGQELIYRGIVGSTGIISLPDDYLSKIPIPHFPEDLCLELTRLVKESMMAKRESKRLLEEAKTRLEQLIEEAANKN